MGSSDALNEPRHHAVSASGRVPFVNDFETVYNLHGFCLADAASTMSTPEPLKAVFSSFFLVELAKLALELGLLYSGVILSCTDRGLKLVAFLISRLQWWRPILTSKRYISPP
jgi:hypothetical protein